MAFTRGSSSFGLVGASGALLVAVLCGASRAGAQSVHAPPLAGPAAPAQTGIVPLAGPAAPAQTGIVPPTTTESTPDADSPPDEAARPSTQPMQPGQGMVLVHLSAGDRPFQIYFGRGRLPIADCNGECEFWAWPGKYRVRVQRGEGLKEEAQLALRVRRSGNFAFVPANGKTQNAGLVLGISGSVIGFVGLVFTAAGLFATCSDPPPGESCAKPTGFYVGLAALAAGNGLSTAGWLLYAHNRAHFSVTDSPPRPSGPRVGLVPLPHGGLGLGAALSF